MKRSARIGLSLAAPVALAIGAACAPPPAPKALSTMCGVTPVTHRVIQWSSDGDHSILCGENLHIVVADYKCGPLLATKAEDDVCVTFLQVRTGDFITGPMSMMVPGDRVYLTYP